ncbi:MAG: hypothetical protein V4857_14490 [Pseudomonadota bacterium]
MDKFLLYAFEVLVLAYLVVCYLVYRYSHSYWGHDFFSFKSFLIAMAACGLVWTALYCKMPHGDPNFFQKHKKMLITAAVVLYVSTVVLNIYKTGFIIGVFGSLIQASVYGFLALYCYKAVILVLVMMPYLFVVCSGGGRAQGEAQIVYRSRNY